MGCRFRKVLLLYVLFLRAIWCQVWCGDEERVVAPVYKDPKQPVEARVEDLLSRMTLWEKLGQMTQIDRSLANESVIQDYAIGSVLNGGSSAPDPHSSPSDWADMIDRMQHYALQTRLGIPIIYGLDAVHGQSCARGTTIFPHNIGLGATRDPDLARRIGIATAIETRGTGVHYAFAPCVAVSRDPRWGRCFESYGEDPDLVRSMTDIITGLQGEPPEGHKRGFPFVGGDTKVVSCAKHYVGDGGTFHGIDENNTITSYDDLVKIHMAPYFDAIDKSVCTVMISYSSWNGKKMHTNEFLITEVLKKQLGFQGFTISDWEGLDRTTDPPASHYNHSVYASISAGMDMVMVPYHYKTYMTDLLTLVSAGEISQERIDDAARRILRVKFATGLFEKPFSNRILTSMVGSAEHRALAREAVRKSLVLLKNGKTPESLPLLPLSKKARKILVAGSHANNLGYQCGGWTIYWQGGSGETTIGTTILQAIKSTVSSTTQVIFEENPDAHFMAKHDFQYAIVVVGEPPYAEGDGDNMNLTLPSLGREAIQTVCGSSAVKCVVILISGRPLVIQPYLPLMDALVAAWLPGTEGQGVADVIFGDHDFHGKLPRTWFKTVDQLPMNVGDEVYDPLFPYGFGLRMNLGTLSDSSSVSSA